MKRYSIFLIFILFHGLYFSVLSQEDASKYTTSKKQENRKKPINRKKFKGISTSLKAYGERFNLMDGNGKKVGVWIESKNNVSGIGIYKDDKKDSVWQYYNVYSGELVKEVFYGKRKVRKIRASFGGPAPKKANDTLIHVLFNFFDKRFSVKNKNSALQMSDVKIIIQNIKDSTEKNFSINGNEVVLSRNTYYKIKFIKKGFITREFDFKTLIPKFAVKTDTLYIGTIRVNMSDKVMENDPMLLGKASNIFVLREIYGGIFFQPDNWYLVLQKRRLSQMDEFEKRKKMIEIENSINEEILSLKEEQLMLENEKKMKEEELKVQESEIKRKQLELELLSKDKAVTDLMIKTKEAELLKNLALANEKKKEIENLNQQKLIDGLTIKNKETELAKKNIEAEKKQREISVLNQEKKFTEQSLQQQKSIQKLTLAATALIMIFLGFVFYSLKKTREKNKLIANQKVEVERQKDLAENQKHLIQEKQKEIIESITYAKRLQEAILPPFSFFQNNVTDCFVYYQPKDIVAGDFYWAENVDDLLFIAAADSTGHGVPGAMVSVVCSNALNRSLKEFNLRLPGQILDKTKELVVETFSKNNENVKDGMDISLLCIDKKNKNIRWSGANNPLWYIENGEFYELKADKQPIGKTELTKPFTTHEFGYSDKIVFYLFTDGFADQFGGPRGKKFKYKPFADLLIENNSQPMHRQKELLSEKFNLWKSDLEQVDDVCVIGVCL